MSRESESQHRPSDPSQSADERVLDLLLGRFIRDICAGKDIRIEELLADRPDLREDTRRVLAMANRIGVRRADRAPQIAGFEVLGVLGQGGMGTVYLARQEALGRYVALKALPSHLVSSDKARERFEREIRAVARLKHELILPVYQVGSVDEQPYFTMEMVEGRTLAQVLDTVRALGVPASELAGSHFATAVLGDHVEGQVPERWRRTWVEAVAHTLIDAADAIGYAHGQGVIHRDLKPSNLMMRRDSRALVFDFGLAKVGSDATLTMSGEFVGTPSYVSPEQIAPKASGIDSRTDIYSLGVTLYELLTLAVPFSGETPQHVFGKILGKEPSTVRRLNPHVPRDLETICMRAMEKSPERRYQTAAALAADLRAFLGHRPVMARRNSATTRLRLWVRREPLLAALLGAMSLGMATIAGLGGFLLARGPEIRAGQEKIVEEQVELALMLTEGSERDRYRARAASEKALKLSPESVEATAALALTAWRWEGAHAALAVLDGHRKVADASQALLRLRAFLLGMDGRSAEANDLENRLGQPAGALDCFLAGRAEMYRGLRGDPDAARRAVLLLSLAIRLSPRPRLSFFMTWAAAADLADDAAARLESVAALEYHWPNSSRALCQIAEVLTNSDPARALSAVGRALVIYPGERGLLLDRARILAKLGDREGAASGYREIQKLTPCWEAYLGLGTQLAALGQLDEAAEQLNLALSLAPGLPEVQKQIEEVEVLRRQATSRRRKE